MPALNDWSSSNALIGQDLFETMTEKSPREGMLKIGSKPNATIGGSFKGFAHKRIRAKRLASTKAISTGASPSSSGDKCKMNYRQR